MARHRGGHVAPLVQATADVLENLHHRRLVGGGLQPRESPQDGNARLVEGVHLPGKQQDVFNDDGLASQLFPPALAGRGGLGGWLDLHRHQAHGQQLVGDGVLGHGLQLALHQLALGIAPAPRVDRHAAA